MAKKILKENDSKSLNREPKESVTAASSAMKAKIESGVNKEIKDIVADILNGNTKKAMKYAFSKESKGGESMGLKEEEEKELEEKELLVDESELNTSNNSNVNKMLGSLKKGAGLKETENPVIDSNPKMTIEKELSDMGYGLDETESASIEGIEEDEEIDLSNFESHDDDESIDAEGNPVMGNDEASQETIINDEPSEEGSEFSPEADMEGSEEGSEDGNVDFDLDMTFGDENSEEAPEAGMEGMEDMEGSEKVPETGMEDMEGSEHEAGETPEFEAGEESEEEMEKESMLPFGKNMIGEVEATEYDELGDDDKKYVDECMKEAEAIKESIAKELKNLDEKIISTKVKDKLAIGFEMYAEQKAKAIAKQKAVTVMNKVNEYLQYVVKEFVSTKEKQINEAIESAKKVEMYEDMKMVVERFYGKNSLNSLNESKKEKTFLTRVISEQKKMNEALESKLNEAKNKISEMECVLIFNESTKNMTVSDKERVAEFMESFNYKNSGDFKNKLNIVVEKFQTLKENKTSNRVSNNLTEDKIKKAAAQKQISESKSKLIKEEKQNAQGNDDDVVDPALFNFGFLK